MTCETQTRPIFAPPLAEIGVTLNRLGKWRCHCDRVHAFGPYAQSHWDEEITHRCASCGTERTFLDGEVIEIR
jgi:hypothetical protein